MTEDIKKTEMTKYIEDSTALSGNWKELTVRCPHCTSDQHCYIYEDHISCYCLSCDEDFDLSDIDGYDAEEVYEIDNTDLISNDPVVVKQAADKILDGKTNSVSDIQLPGHSHKYIGNHSNFSTNFSTCNHEPVHIIDGEDWGVWIGRKFDCISHARNFDVILNLTYTSIKEPHVIPIPELKEFEDADCTYKEIRLDWPDYGVVNLPKEFWSRLLLYLEKNHLRMLVFCVGGHGRTGTAAAILMSLALDMTPSEAIEWLRKNYCWSAIETTGQESYVGRMTLGLEKLAKEAESLNPSVNSSIKSVDTKLEQAKEMYEDYLNKSGEMRKIDV